MSRLRITLLLPFAAALVASVTACNPATPYAAIVNGSRISQAQLSRELKDLSANSAFRTVYDQSAASQQPPRPGVLNGDTAHPTFTQSFTSAVLGIDIQAAVVHAEVVRRHIQPNPADVVKSATATAAGQQFGNDANNKPVFDRFSPWLRRVFELRQAEVDALGKSLPAAPVLDAAAIQAFYDKNPQDFITAQCQAHILVKTEDQANAVAAQLAAGADFAALAAQSSTDTTTAAKGGDMGCGAPGTGTNPIQQDQQFVARSSTAPVGKVTGPFQVTGGWDLLKVASRTQQPLTDVVKQAILRHLQQGTTSPLSQFFQQAAKTLKVTVNPQYGHWDSAQLAIIAPTAPDPARSGLPVASTTTVPAALTPPIQTVPAPPATPGPGDTTAPPASASPPTSTP